ncbi:MAG: hypothetical protein N2689_07135 [Verrucomicrobiae bacterium]|nr:hypothetical protein [Verrucomicrobiae bacterium]
MITRREILKAAAASLVLRAMLVRGAERAATIEQVRAKTLRYIENMRFRDGPFGRYRYAEDMPEPTLYSSTYAAMTRGLYRDLHTLTSAQRREWVAYLQSHQDDDGLYRDPRIFGEGWYKDDPEWCGRRHLTCHVLTALTCLGAVAAKPLRMLEPFYEKAKLIAWLEARDWSKVDFVGNEVLNLGTLLQYARDFQKEPRAAGAIRLMLDWLARHHLNPDTGLWGSIDVNEAKGISRAVMGAYHFWLLFFYDRAPIPYPDRAVDSVLRTENPKGGFGWGVHGPASSACEDMDSIDPLARLLVLADYRRDDIRAALRRAEAHVLGMQNDDGGFVWTRGTAFSYGHPLMAAGKDASGMFPTWFRTLSLAYLGKALPDSAAGRFNWHFPNAPGIQFWLPDKTKPQRSPP